MPGPGTGKWASSSLWFRVRVFFRAFWWRKKDGILRISAERNKRLQVGKGKESGADATAKGASPMF